MLPWAIEACTSMCPSPTKQTTIKVVEQTIWTQRSMGVDAKKDIGSEHSNSVRSADLQNVREGTGSAAWAIRVTTGRKTLEVRVVLNFVCDAHFRFSWNKVKSLLHTKAYWSCFTFPAEFYPIPPLLLPRERKRKSQRNQWPPHFLGIEVEVCTIAEQTVKFWDLVNDTRNKWWKVWK